MAISIYNIYIIFIYYSISFGMETINNKLNLNNYDELSKNINFTSLEVEDQYLSPQINIKEAITLFPISYLTYIIKGFLPNLTDSTEVNNSSNISSLVQYIMQSYCFANYFEEYQKNTSFIYDIIRYSGKSYPDFGDEEGCISSKNAYLLLCISFNLSDPKVYTGKFKLLPFILNGHSFYGLCTKNTSNCTYILASYLKVLLSNISLLNSSFTLDSYIHYPDKGVLEKYKDRINIYKTIFLIIIIYLLLKIIVDIISIKLFADEEKQKNKKNDSSSSSSSSSCEEEEEEEKSEKKESKEVDANQPLIEKKEDDLQKISKKEKYPKLYSLYKFLSLKIAFKSLFKNKGKLYDETDLYLIIFFKLISIIFKTLYMNIYLMTKTPSKEINNISFFDGLLTILIKYTSFSDIIFILCESIIVAYKLMSFIRKYTDKNEEPSFKLFLNFFIRIFPSFVITFSIFFLFYFFSEANMYSSMPENMFSRTSLQYMRDKLIYCHSCVNDIKSLIPFHMQYNFDETKSECFQFMIIMINLFYCYLFFILLMYIGFKVKNKIFDFFIFIILLINFVFPNDIICNYQSINDKTLNINLLFGETCSTKVTHIFLKYYFLGFFIGLSIFYNNDITHENSLQNSSIYKPFHFLQDIIVYIYLRTFCTKLLIILLMIIIQFLLSVSFLLYTNGDLQSILNNGTTDRLNFFDNSLYLNEKTCFAIVFGLMVTILYTFKNEAIIKAICNNIIVILFNRIGYGYYALIEIMINYIYCFIQLEVQLNAANILFLLYGIIFYIMFLNLFLVTIIEIPAKILIKQLFGLKTKDKRILKI